MKKSTVITNSVFFLIEHICKSQNLNHKKQLLTLLATDKNNSEYTAIPNGLDLRKINASATHFCDRLGKSGFVTYRARKRVITGLFAMAVLLIIFGYYLGTFIGGFTATIIGGLSGLYVALIITCIFFLITKKSEERKTLHTLPIILESLILLVESGVGILPALEKVIVESKKEFGNIPIFELFDLIYSLSDRGIPFNRALEIAANAAPCPELKHVFLHLDIAGNEGGELIPSLRALGDYAHDSWKNSVEERVRKLENLVVFPVFASVMGLLLLTAAVPLVPVLEFTSKIDNKATSSALKGLQ